MRAIRTAASTVLLGPLAAVALVLSGPAAVADEGGPDDGGVPALDAGPPAPDGGLPPLPLEGDIGGEIPEGEIPEGGIPADGIPAGEIPDGDGFPKEGTGHDITSFGFSVTPSTVAPGGTVTLKSDGCEVPTVTVESGVFDKVTLHEGRPGTATVDSDAKPGARYEVTFDCKGERGTTTLTIAGGGHPTAHPTAHPTLPPTPPTGARKGVKAGFGTGSEDEVGITEVVTGTVLIAGALGAAVVLIRRREGSGT
ncbi:hypothetical protein ACFY7C_05430 [Streptomyces sp. NPDC012769]|uniref:hypothetical protein n=1 Tax=Streptomyces sp. NPDC012769 TaxID=3364848 RepID=UPI0036D00185